jgi:hypothetical protein
MRLSACAPPHPTGGPSDFSIGSTQAGSRAPASNEEIVASEEFAPGGVVRQLGNPLEQHGVGRARIALSHYGSPFAIEETCQPPGNERRRILVGRHQGPPYSYWTARTASEVHRTPNGSGNKVPARIRPPHRKPGGRYSFRPCRRNDSCVVSPLVRAHASRDSERAHAGDQPDWLRIWHYRLFQKARKFSSGRSSRTLRMLRRFDLSSSMQRSVLSQHVHP